MLQSDYEFFKVNENFPEHAWRYKNDLVLEKVLIFTINTWIISYTILEEFLKAQRFKYLNNYLPNNTQSYTLYNYDICIYYNYDIFVYIIVIQYHIILYRVAQ